MKTDILNKISRSAHKVGFTMKKNSPTILVVAGTIGVVASTVLACKATLKINDILEESKETIDKIHEVKDDPKHPSYDEKAAKKDLTIVYAQTGVKLVKLYAPAIITGTLSLGSILMSHRILNKRNFALAAAYTTVDTAFKEYRGRVVERFGEVIDNELKHNVRVEEIEETATNEKGEETVVKKQVRTGNASEYARFFEEYYADKDGDWVKNKCWSPDNISNITYLRGVERMLNDRLVRKGIVTLNEFYEAIGLPATAQGMVVGWVYDDSIDPEGDNYIDFGLERDSMQYTLYVNGANDVILLDPNVDGNIYNRM